MLGLDLREEHPIFRAKRSVIITTKLVHQFTKAESTMEKRLYFLGLLNSTDLIRWKCIAKPSLKTIEDNFMPAFKVASWIDYAYYQLKQGMKFPKYVVDTSTQYMDNIDIWLQEIEDLRDDFITKMKDRDLRAQLTQHTEDLMAELTRAYLKDRIFTPHLVREIFEYTELEDHPKAEIYYQIMITKTQNAWEIDKDDLIELYKLLVDRFDSQHPMFAPFFGQFQQLLEAQKRGAGTFDIIDQDSIELEDESTGSIVEIKTSFAESARSIGINPDGGEPQRKDFARIGDFIKAKALWSLAQKQKRNDAKDEGEQV